MAKVIGLHAKDARPIYRVTITIDRMKPKGSSQADPWDEGLTADAMAFARSLADHREDVFESEVIVGGRQIAHFVPTQIKALRETLTARGFVRLAQQIEADESLGVEVMRLLSLTPKEGTQF